jgi:NDP-sugar pyrophosphorylase family protein
LLVSAASIFEYRDRAKQDDVCSLADGVRLMARDGKARVIDISDGWWQDIDTPEMHHRAEEVLRLKKLRWRPAGVPSIGGRS